MTGEKSLIAGGGNIIFEVGNQVFELIYRPLDTFAGDESEPGEDHQIREVLPTASVEVCDTRVRLRLCSPAKKSTTTTNGNSVNSHISSSHNNNRVNSVSRQLVPVKRKDLFKVSVTVSLNTCPV
jgi:hypothetical protein